ncbi:MAG: bifunctional phosphopantothenoylcysteine decarboxylase/phosphopantothenate--cysteine ligase CoaBC, partial [Erysipelotrichia bacterium]|nr:bifunctional phosphopantothenoylcysteine decarboxylase/phosphopantothenate--cysteine ligase CoaBC [Erysipelotrichia bacterium]
VQHIALAKKADLFMIAPASADIIAKAANGIADDMLTTVFLAAGCCKLIVPAMNTGMLENPITQHNLELCRGYGIHVMDSASGYLACGDIGRGRMPEAAEIEDAAESLLETDRYLSGKKILITAGPTQEALDPVRYVTNHSSGKMGYALARAARNAGAEVTLIAGVNNLPDVYGTIMEHVITAADMYHAVMRQAEKMDVIIMAAAVADYKPKNISEVKIHKADDDMSLPMERTKDILKQLGREKKNGQVLIGFAMETEELEAQAKKKLITKNCDYIIANNLKDPGAGFQKDTNAVTVIAKDSELKLQLMSKDEAAAEILRICLKEKI